MPCFLFDNVMAATTSVKCCNCQQIPEQTCMLPCYHIFCWSCVIKSTGKDSTCKKIRCPLCLEVFTMGPNGLQNFRGNSFLKSVAEVALAAGDSDKSPPCSVDQCVRKGVFQCESGCGCFCEVCEAAHVQSSNHKMELTKSRADKSVTTCDKHQQPEHLYCTDCDTIGCSTCFFLEHREHTCCEVGTTAKEELYKLHDLMESTQNSMLKIDSALLTSTEQATKAEEQFISVEQSIERVTVSLHEKVEKLKSSLMEQLNTARTVTRTKLAQCKSCLTILKSSLSALLNYDSLIAEHDAYFELLSQLKSLQCRTDQIISRCVPTFEWDCHIEREKDDALTQMGSVELHTSSTKNSPVTLAGEHKKNEDTLIEEQKLEMVNLQKQCEEDAKVLQIKMAEVKDEKGSGVKMEWLVHQVEEQQDSWKDMVGKLREDHQVALRQLQEKQVQERCHQNNRPSSATVRCSLHVSLLNTQDISHRGTTVCDVDPT